MDAPSIYGNLKYKQLLKSLKEESVPLDMCKGCGCLEGENLSV